MRWSARQLRWLSLGGALLLAAVLAAFLGLARYRAGVVWQRILKRNGVNLVQESNGITWSQSVKGRTVFTVHAEKSIPHGDGTYGLHNAVLILYGKDGRNDRIHGNEFEYDEKQGILRALGEVQMDLQAPEPAGSGKASGPVTNFSFAPDDEAAADPGVIHVRTSGLLFQRKLEVAATTEPVEFSYRGLRCESVGAEFDSGQSSLHLLAEVKLAGTLKEAPFTVTAARADLDRNADTVTLATATWASGDQAARADHALLSLRKEGSLEKADGEGNVVLRSGTRTLGAPQMHAEFGMENKPRQAVFTRGVQFTDRVPGTTERGTAAGLTLSADAQGVLREAVADGNALLHTEQGGGQGSLGQGSGRQGTTGTRDLKAQHAVAVFRTAADGRRAELKNLHLVGGAQLLTVSAAEGEAGETHTAVRADDLTTAFQPGSRQEPEPQTMTGAGHTVLEQTAADGRRQVSEGDGLDARFAQRGAEGGAARGGSVAVSTAVQTGHVVLHAWPAVRQASKAGTGQAGSGQAGPGQAGTKQASAGREGAGAEPSVGHAERAVYEAAAGTLTLTAEGGARAEVDDGGTQLSAPEIVLHEGTGDGEASGGVALTSVGQPGSPATHALAARAKLRHSTDVAEFYGSDREPAQLWQGVSQVSAANLLLDGRRHTLTARPEAVGALVHGVFASQRTNQGGKTLPSSGGELDVEGASGPGKPVSGKSSPGKSVPARSDLARGASAAGELRNQRQTAASGDAVRVAAEALDYSDPEHQATFHGHVTLLGAQGTLQGDRGAVFLQDPSVGNGLGETKTSSSAEAGGMAATSGIGGRLERFVLMGNVHLVQPGRTGPQRTGQGQQLTYTAATDRFVLTGTPATPPRVVDAEQGLVTGETLLFGSADKSVVVAGMPAAPGVTPGRRVHTETDIKR